MLESLRARWWDHTPRADDEDGITLIEVMIAGFVLSVAVLALASVASTSLVSVRDSRERDRATAAASSALEAARALPYDEIALRTGGGWAADPLIQPSGSDHLLDHDGDGSFTETIWASGTGAMHPYVCRSDEPGCWFEMPGGALVEVRTFVSWYEEDGERVARRVTAVATWDDPAFPAPRTVRMSTVIAPATSGLPAPAFEVVPRRLTTSLDQIAIDAGREECFEHTITNFGADDSYQLVLDETAGWNALSPHADGTWRDENWVFRAYFVQDGQSIGPETLMVADPDATNNHLNSPTALETGASARMHLCYTPRPGGGDGTRPTSDGSPYGSEPAVRSHFDPEVTQDVEHEIHVLPALRLFLHHDAEALAGTVTARPVRARAGLTISTDLISGSLLSLTQLLAGQITVNAYLFERFPMHTSLPPSASSLPDYDLNLAFGDETISLEDLRLNRPGLFQPRTAMSVGGVIHTSELFAAEWDYQFDVDAAPITVGDARINLWATRFGGETPRASAEYCVRAQLLRFARQPDGSLSSDPTLVGEVSQRFPVPDQDSNAPQGFRKLSVPEFTVPLAGGQASFEEGDVLRLRVWNDGHLVSGLVGADCVTFHIGYGVDLGGGDDPPAFAASLDLTSVNP